ncbi:MAG: hypothetical protein AUI50_01550 [Crenarchaeota archaeon 13_1_40CM_2_52_14]|nr:MAG: hypothetical protein AUI50_01550 [Crenarchaeota archaeon 13_1_40CM_2_52_14]
MNTCPWEIRELTPIPEMGVIRIKGCLTGRKILAAARVKLPRYGREGAVEARPFPAKKRLRVSEAQGLSGEAVKGNPPTTVIPGVDESKSSPRTTKTRQNPPLQ